MVLGTFLVCAVLWDFRGIACFPFYAVVPLITFSTSLYARALLLGTRTHERHALLTIGAGVASIATEFLSAWLIDKVDIGTGWEYVLWGTLLGLPIVFGWVSLRRRD